MKQGITLNQTLSTGHARKSIGTVYNIKPSATM